MEQESEKPQPPKRPIRVAFLLAIVGLLLLDGAVHFFARPHGDGRAWLLLAAGLGFLVLAVLWASKRI